MARTPFGSKGREGGPETSFTPATPSSSSSPGGLTAFIDQGSEFEGKLSFNDTVRIDGRFRGEISSENTLIVGEAGEIEATITSKTVAISGTVIGDITAATKLVLHKTARVQGNLEAGSLVIEDGAQLNGQVRMGKATGKPGASIPPSGGAGQSLKAIDGGQSPEDKKKS